MRHHPCWEDPEQDTAETDEGGKATVVEKGEPVAMINDKVDFNVNLGQNIPSMDMGSSLGAEYQGAIAQDDTLREWKSGVLLEQMASVVF